MKTALPSFGESETCREPIAWWDDDTALTSVLDRYDNVKKKIVEELVPNIRNCFNKTEMSQVGHDLGLVRKGVFHFDSEEQMAVLMDYLLMFSRMHGTTPCERYLKLCKRSNEDEITRASHEALSSVRYTFLTLDDPRPGFGYVCHDILLGRCVFLVDRSMSKTPPRTFALATAVISVDNWVMTTGAALPFSARSVDAATEIVRDTFDDLGLAFHIPVKLVAKHHSKLALTFIRAITASGGLDHVRYAQS